MTVVKMAARYHELGWAMRRLMGADNVRASSQREFAQKMSQEGYIVGQQLISDYMRNRTVEDEETGKTFEVPRALPPMEFIAAVITTFQLNAAQREDLVSSWLEILPEKRRIAVLGLCETLRGADVPSNAWQDMLAFEQERQSGELSGGEGGRSAGGTTS
jgi:hypothetical protein